MSNELQSLEPKPTRKPYGLPKAIDSFCRNVANGYNLSESYRMAYPKAKTQNPQRLLKREDVGKRIAHLREIRFKDNALSVAEKRDFLARAVRTPIAEITEASDLAQKVTREIRGDKEGDRAGEDAVTTLKIESVNKLAALAEDSKLAGHNFADQPQNQTNSFAFLIGVFDHLTKAKQIETPSQPAIDV